MSFGRGNEQVILELARGEGSFWASVLSGEIDCREPRALLNLSNSRVN